MAAVAAENLDDVFTYHPPKSDFQKELYHRLRQAAKEAARVVLENPSYADRVTAIEKFTTVIQAHTADCRDAQEAFGCLQAAIAFARASDRGAERPSIEMDADEATQAIISSIRAALMWANASIALEGRI